MPEALVVLRPFFMIGFHPVNVDHAYNVILLTGEIFLSYHFIINISFV